MTEPAYQRVYQTIKSRIVEKQYDIGTILPPEPEIEKEFGVSRTTVRKAIDMLARDRYICVRQGFGTQVVSRKAVQNLNRFTSISESLAQKGKVIGLRSCFVEKIAAPEKVAATLGVKVGTPVICVHRIRTADGAPISLSKNYILAQYAPGLENQTQIPHLYDYLKEHYGITYTGSQDIISASNASFEQAHLLEIEPKSSLLSVWRICYFNGRPYEVDEVKIVAEMYEYEVFIGDAQR